MFCGTIVGYAFVFCGTTADYVFVFCGTTADYIFCVVEKSSAGCVFVLWNSCRLCFGVLCGFEVSTCWVSTPPPPLNYMPQTKCSCRR